MATENPMAGSNPMAGYGNAGGGSSNPLSLASGYGWGANPMTMNWGGAYGPMSWPSWNQQSMNAQGLYGAMFNPYLMMGGQQGQQGQPGAPAPAPQATPMPSAPAAPPTSLASPHFAYMTGTGTPTEGGHSPIGWGNRPLGAAPGWPAR